MKRPITIATWDYDRVRAIIDGRVTVEGCDVNYLPLAPEECFHRTYLNKEFDVAEIGFSPHLIALSVSVGLIFLTDLRLMGLFLRQIPVADVLHGLRPYVLCGFALVFISGGLLFWAEAAEVIASPAWVFKFVFIGLAGLNALYFELVIARRPGALSPDRATLPPGVKYAGAASLAIWTLVIICGRLIAYL